MTSQTTETSITYARPDGSMVTITNVLPVRLLVDGSWRPLSATLHLLKSGRLAPEATPSGLTLSDGGAGPLAIFTSPAGGRFAISFPARLPVPVASGASAAYHSVLPGVDLLVTATVYGGITETLEIHNARAAASRALRSLRLALAARGLSVGTLASGNLLATGPGGRIEFTGSAPVIWDSRSTRTSAQSGRARMLAPAASSTAGPGRDARMAAVTARVSGGVLTLTAPADMTSSAATYPDFLASSVSPMFTSGGFTTKSTRGSLGYAMARDNCPGTPDWNNPNPGVGWQDYYPDCGGGASMYRTFWQINTSNLNNNMLVQKATFSVWENYGADFNCNDRWPLYLKWTGPINSGTDWSNQPGVDSHNITRTTSIGPAYNPNSPTCPKSVQADFDVTYAIAKAAAGNWDAWTVGLYGDESRVSTNYGFMRFGTNPQIVTTFDLYPPAPTNLKESPAPKDTPGGPDDYGCGAATGWINQRTLSLSATVSSNITGEQVQGQFETLDVINSSPAVQVNSPYQDSGTTATVSWPASGDPLLDGHQYAWYPAANVDGSTPGDAGGTDGNNTSGYATWSNAVCYFNVDVTKPDNVGVSSTDYPGSGSGKTTTKQPGQSGVFTLTANDPTPTTTGCGSLCQVSGVYRLYYSLNTPVPTGGGGMYVNAPANSGGPVQVNTPAITVGNWGTNILYVMAQDAAGNWSTQFAYTFYVPWVPGTPVHPGDINGDGIPDLLGTTSTNLDLFPGNADPSATPVTAGTQATTPDGTGWNTFQITHRGSFSQGSVDDLFMHKGNNLYVYLNNLNSPGAAPQFGNTGDINPIPADPTCATTFPDNTTRSGNCLNYPTTNNWSKVTQILAPGDAWTGSTMDNGEPSLLTVENNELWAYQGQFGGQVGYPVLLGSSSGTTNWSQMTLIAPGIVNGQLTLWARDNNPSDPNNGKIFSWPLVVGSDDLPTLNPSSPATPVTATSGTIISGISVAASSYPAVGSPGAMEGGYPGLYVETTSNGPAGVNCANGCMYYYPGQSTNGGTSPPLNPTAVFLGVLNTPVSQLS